MLLFSKRLLCIVISLFELAALIIPCAEFLVLILLFVALTLYNVNFPLLYIRAFAYVMVYVVLISTKLLSNTVFFMISSFVFSINPYVVCVYDVIFESTNLLSVMVICPLLQMEAPILSLPVPPACLTVVNMMLFKTTIPLFLIVASSRLLLN